ncbi:DUF3309 family protein [Vogesella indigofera]|uniref:DUF3309 family protein n=1 Tax=Vogesella indigofera TaxID=45465 RepID=UPI003F8E9660
MTRCGSSPARCKATTYRWERPNELGTILQLGATPGWLHSHRWGYRPSDRLDAVLSVQLMHLVFSRRSLPPMPCVRSPAPSPRGCRKATSGRRSASAASMNATCWRKVTGSPVTPSAPPTSR